jgi:DnaJ-class molecular chaperone
MINEMRKLMEISDWAEETDKGELMPCPECAGTGASDGVRCETCNGEGEVFDS